MLAKQRKSATQTIIQLVKREEFCREKSVFSVMWFVPALFWRELCKVADIRLVY